MNIYYTLRRIQEDNNQKIPIIVLMFDCVLSN